MARFQLLNNVEHKDLRVITDRSAALGDNVMYVPTFPAEFRSVQRHYPICFLRNADKDEVMAVALFGVQEGENLFLHEGGWDAGYIPLNIRRQPFLVGFQEQEDFGETVREPVVTIDSESARISRNEGEALFLEHGGNTDFLEHVSSMLKVLFEGTQRSQPFFEALDELNLIESFVLDVALEDGSEQRLSGFHTINEDVLKELDADQLADLHQRGYLDAIYMVIASMAKMPDLLQRKIQRIEEGDG